MFYRLGGEGGSGDRRRTLAEAKMLETMIPSTTTHTTFVKCGVVPSSASEAQDPLRWDCQQFPADSNSTTFSPIKQEVMDTYNDAFLFQYFQGTTSKNNIMKLEFSFERVKFKVWRII